ncbi:MAG: bifunctional UDP-N-acetylmuramoyl-tripeptide:D-alanyl-D-alanine ligase/alanine racemase [Bacteroidetes bacterium]|nr:bifunctional UDP-N-acetylmuramoyl-tripeptide:D-alanyl-D-alanine ligase/alanine racemase [Bacteroidota bacterium]
MNYTLKDIAKIVGGTLYGGKPDWIISHLCIDSRSVNYPVNSLFIALKTQNGDGAKFIKEAYLKGVISFLVGDEKDIPKDLLDKVNFIVYDLPIEALQKLATYNRRQFDVPVIGITGSNGKTVVKEWLYQLMNDKFLIARSPKSYNSQIGVPLSVWQLQNHHTLGIFEAGISQPNEMQKLGPIISPEVGIFTNIGAAHQSNFSSVSEKVWEKIALFKNAKKIIYCKDYQEIEEVIQSAKDKNYFTNNPEIISWSFQGNVSCSISDKLTEIKIKFDERQIGFTIAYTDKASIENATHCAFVMLQFGYTDEKITLRMQLLQPVEMRLEIKAGINNSTLINDTYNSDLQSLNIALDLLNQQHQHPQKTVIISDILQTGNPKLYEEVSDLISQKSITTFIGIGDEISTNRNLFQPNSVFYKSTEDFLKEFDFNSFGNQAILVKGSRVFGFEKIANRLQQKLHNTVLEIDLNALVNNLNAYRSLLKPNVKIMGMVKAFSYGSGAYEIANILQFHKADYLAVAYADEGIMLREKGINLPIMVMSPTTDSLEQMIKNNLEPEVFSTGFLEEINHFIANNPASKINIHIKVDTGMHRLGLLPREVDRFLEIISQNNKIHVASVFSHLASADVPEHDEFTHQQIDIFNSVCNQIESEIGYPFLKHISNTSGISRLPNAQFDMVRLGIGLYGIDTGNQIQNQLESVSTLKTYISQIKEIPEGETVGYSRKGIATHPTKIAVIGIGYADGFPRSLSNGKGKVLVIGKEASVIGNVCMDMTMIDITGIEAHEGDEVIIFGENMSIEKMAEAMETIPYEVLTSISPRVKRVYYKA